MKLCSVYSNRMWSKHFEGNILRSYRILSYHSPCYVISTAILLVIIIAAVAFKTFLFQL